MAQGRILDVPDRLNDEIVESIFEPNHDPDPTRPPADLEHIAFGPISRHSNLMAFRPISEFVQDPNNIILITENQKNNIAINKTKLREMLQNERNLFLLCRRSAAEYDYDQFHPFTVFDNPKFEHVYERHRDLENQPDAAGGFYHKPTLFFGLGQISSSDVMIPKRVFDEILKTKTLRERFSESNIFLIAKENYSLYRGNYDPRGAPITPRDRIYEGITERHENRFARLDTIRLGEGDPWYLIEREATRCTSGGDLRTLRRINPTSAYLRRQGIRDMPGFLERAEGYAPFAPGEVMDITMSDDEPEALQKRKTRQTSKKTRSKKTRSKKTRSKQRKKRRKTRKRT